MPKGVYPGRLRRLLVKVVAILSLVLASWSRSLLVTDRDSGCKSAYCMLLPLEIFLFLSTLVYGCGGQVASAYRHHHD